MYQEIQILGCCNCVRIRVRVCFFCPCAHLVSSSLFVCNDTESLTLFSFRTNSTRFFGRNPTKYGNRRNEGSSTAAANQSVSDNNDHDDDDACVAGVPPKRATTFNFSFSQIYLWLRNELNKHIHALFTFKFSI